VRGTPAEAFETRRTDCAAIVSAVLALGRGLETKTVARGVETEQQFGVLCAAGVTLVQGELFGRPCPMSDLVIDDVVALRMGRECGLASGTQNQIYKPP
jgi:EAL domain-containing protein (putative c-di-GMP-specific phosphodiesterase class I)